MNQQIIINVADIPFDDGTTPRQRNNAMNHTIPLGTKVSFEDYDEDGDGKLIQKEGYVLAYIRDCDGTPLYMTGESFELIKIYQEADKKYHEIQYEIKTVPKFSHEAHQLQQISDAQVSMMFKAFQEFNNPYSMEHLEVIEQSTQEKIDICNNAKIIWGPDFYNRFYDKRHF